MSIHEFALPDLGEGLTEGEILSWRVSVGDRIALNDPLVEVETAKAAVEIPSPYAGQVAEILVDAGRAVEVGQVIVRIDDGVPSTDADGKDDSAAATREPLLVGYGVSDDRRARRRRARAAGTPVATSASPHAPAIVAASTPVSAPTPSPALALAAPDLTPALPTGPMPGPSRPADPTTPTTSGTTTHPRVKPPLRKFAKERGVDLTAIAGSGPGGTITRLDIMTALAPATAQPHPAAVPNGRPVAAAGDQRIPVRGVRAATARAMVASAQVPQVTVFHTVDVTGTVELLAQLRELPEFAGIKVSPLLLVARALLRTCRLHPDINASWDDGTGDGPVRIVHGGVNLGIAAETERGLIVPNIRDAGGLSLVDLARALAGLIETARAGTASPADLTGGTITITNVGVFGVDVGAPLLNPGEGAILCAGAIEERPWVHEGELAVRRVMQLALTVDHRIIDGGLASRALADVGAALTHPLRALIG